MIVARSYDPKESAKALYGFCCAQPWQRRCVRERRPCTVRHLLACSHFAKYRERHAAQCDMCVRCYHIDHADVRVRDLTRRQNGIAAREAVERCSFLRVAPSYRTQGGGLEPGGLFHPTTGVTSPKRDPSMVESTVYRPCMSVTAHCPKKEKTHESCDDNLKYFPRFADTRVDHAPQRRFQSSPMMLVAHYQRLPIMKRCAELELLLDLPTGTCNSTAWKP